MDGKIPELSLDARHARIVLAVAICVFVVQGWFIAGVLPVNHEEVSAHAAPPLAELTIENGIARSVESCTGRSSIVFTHGRPILVLCAGGLAWPILVTNYIGGVHYWPLQLLRPLHHGDPIALRRTALSIGVLALIVLFLLVERVGDSLQAATAVSVAAVLPIFVFLYSFLILFETVPPLLVACAALVVAQRADPNAPPTPQRAAVAGALVGLAVFGNVKAVVLVVPLLAFALFESPALRRTSRRAWVAAGIAAGLAFSPMAVAASFGHEITSRLGVATSRLDPRLLAAELFYPLVMAVDPRYFLDGGLWPLTLLIPALAFVYSVVAFVRALRRLPHDRIAAACGALQLFCIVFVWLAYDQTIRANYGPIVCVQAASIGCMIVAVGRWVGEHGRSPFLGLALMGAITIVSLVPNSYRRGNPRDLAMSNNLHAERALGAYLRHTPGGPVMVTTYNLAGLPEAFTGRSALRLDVALARCRNAPDAERCEREVIVAAIEAVPDGRFLVPLRMALIDEAAAGRVVATIEDAARFLGARAREEARFATRRGDPVLALVVVEPTQRDAPNPDAGD